MTNIREKEMKRRVTENSDKDFAEKFSKNINTIRKILEKQKCDE